jgi:hypothetical protein
VYVYRVVEQDLYFEWSQPADNPSDSMSFAYDKECSYKIKNLDTRYQYVFYYKAIEYQGSDESTVHKGKTINATEPHITDEVIIPQEWDEYYCGAATPDQAMRVGGQVGQDIKLQPVVLGKQLGICLYGGASTDAGIRLSWMSVKGATGYIIYRREGQIWQPLAKTAASAYQYVDEGVAKGVWLNYAIQAVSDKRMGVLAIGGGAQVMSFDTPRLISAVAEPGQITVSWNPVAGANSYQVFRKSSDEQWKYLGTTGLASYTDKGVKKDSTYCYTVTPENIEWHTLYPDEAPPPAPTEPGQCDETGISCTAE